MYSTCSFPSPVDYSTTQVTSTEWSRMQLFKLQLVEIKINCRCRGSSLSEKESLCKTVKWHRVPVLSHRWWFSVHHAEQGMSRPVRGTSGKTGERGTTGSLRQPRCCRRIYHSVKVHAEVWFVNSLRDSASFRRLNFRAIYIHITGNVFKGVKV